MDGIKIPSKRDIRLVNRPINDVAGILKGHVKKQGWIISEETTEDSTLCIVAKNPRASSLRLFYNNSPQIAVWNFYPDGKGTKVEMFFELFQSSRIWFYGFAISILMTVEYYVFQFFSNKSNPISFAKFLLSLTLWGVFHSCIAYVKRYREFREGFYSLVSDTYGIQEVKIQEGFYFPELSKYFAITIFFVLQILLIISAYSLSGFSGSGPVAAPLILKITLFLIFIGVAFTAYICYKPRFASRLKLGLFGMQAGALLSIYALFPALHPIIASHFHLGPELILILLALSLVLFIMVFMAVNMYDTARELAEEIYQSKIKLDSPPADSLSASPEATDFKPFSLAILIIWLSFSLINLIGLYFSLSFTEYILFGKNFLFHNPSSKAFFDGDFFSKVLWGGYAVPLLGLWFVFAYKRTKEFLDSYKLMMKNQAPQELQAMIADICSFAGVNMPKIVISSEDVIAANVKHIFLFGTALKITQKTLRELNKQELEALLAHEVFHLKKHSLKFSILNSLSEWTLFGSGFLTLVQDSKEVEFEADRFSLAWLKEKGLGRGVLINLLDKVSLLNSASGLAFSDSAMSFSASLRKKDAKNLDPLALLRFIDEMFFGDMVISYIHPTASERIRRIELA